MLQVLDASNIAIELMPGFRQADQWISANVRLGNNNK